MAYSNNPNLPKARALAMKLLLKEGLPLQVVANKCGVHRSTIWRWKQKWQELNKNVQFTNPNRPTRPVSLKNKLSACRWSIATRSSRPHFHPHTINSMVVSRILELRAGLQRCAEVIWHYLIHEDGISISLSSVRRILRRHHCFDGARKNRVKFDNPRRPQPTYPGELVQTDTIHYICPITYRRRYVYTVIDLYSRMTYAEISSSIRPGIAANAVLRAQELWGFNISMVQADNGPEFSSYFEGQMSRKNIQVRHSRLGRPNDNAHIERFNRTVQEECLGSRFSYRTTNTEITEKLEKYLDYYNNHRVHLGLQLKRPIEMLRRS